MGYWSLGQFKGAGGCWAVRFHFREALWTQRPEQDRRREKPLEAGSFHAIAGTQLGGHEPSRGIGIHGLSFSEMTGGAVLQSVPAASRLRLCAVGDLLPSAPFP